MGVDHADVRLRLCGVTAGAGLPGATNAAVFEHDVQEVLVPELKPGDVGDLDNLKPHNRRRRSRPSNRPRRAWCRCRRGVRT